MHLRIPLLASALLFFAACGDETVAPAVDTTVGETADDAMAPGPDTAPTDAAAEDATTTAPGAVGAPCNADDDCGGANPTCLGLPSGYCAPDCSTTDCPEGSVCFEFDGGDMLCLASCGDNSDCRTDEGYICDDDDTCWHYDDAPGGDSPIGGPCRTDEDCRDTGATCYEEGFDGNSNGFVGGYCLVFGCTTNSCPQGGTCITVTSDGDTACFAACGDGLACPQAKGYLCAADDSTCWPGCEGDGDCPAGYGCHPDDGFCVKGWTNEAFVCDGTRFEPNDAWGTATALEVPSVERELDLCASDEDWYSIEAPAATLTTVGIEFPHVRGDLDLLAYDENGTLLGSRLGPENYTAINRGYENGLEYHSVLNMRDTVRARFRVKAFSGATNQYDVHVTKTEWVDGALCTEHFAADECRGYTGRSEGRIYQFPFPRADDPYVPDGYMLESVSSYRWARRELIMLVRHAIHEVQAKFPGTTSLGLIDMADKNAVTPGFDIGDPRHPETTHDQGGNIDIAYYQTDGANDGAIVCGPNERANNDGYFCTSTNGHIMDVPRTTYFIAVLASYPRTRVIGVDTKLAALIEAEALRQRDAGDITATQYQNLMSRLAYGEGWPFHHHHLHLSLRWWSQDAASPNGLVVQPEPEVGCGFRMPGDGELPPRSLRR
jgi:hypothetical protein